MASQLDTSECKETNATCRYSPSTRPTVAPRTRYRQSASKAATISQSRLSALYFIGRDKGKSHSIYAAPALLDLEKAEKIGLSMDDLLMHYVYVNLSPGNLEAEGSLWENDQRY
jgi:hypothetical protein